jgi:hypothetical protein
VFRLIGYGIFVLLVGWPSAAYTQQPRSFRIEYACDHLLGYPSRTLSAVHSLLGDCMGLELSVVQLLNGNQARNLLNPSANSR